MARPTGGTGRCSDRGMRCLVAMNQRQPASDRIPVMNASPECTDSRTEFLGGVALSVFEANGNELSLPRRRPADRAPPGSARMSFPDRVADIGRRLSVPHRWTERTRPRRLAGRLLIRVPYPGRRGRKPASRLRDFRPAFSHPLSQTLALHEAVLLCWSATDFFRFTRGGPDRSLPTVLSEIPSDGCCNKNRDRDS